MRSPRPFDCVAGPELLGALVDYILAYRTGGRPAEAMQRETLQTFPNASGGDFAVALVRANRRETAR